MSDDNNQETQETTTKGIDLSAPRPTDETNLNSSDDSNIRWNDAKKNRE